MTKRLSLLLAVLLLLLSPLHSMPWTSPRSSEEALKDSGSVLCVPDRIDLGDIPMSATGHASVWVINTGSEAVEIRGAKPTCGCLTLDDFQPRTLAPQEAASFALTADPPEHVGTPKTSSVRFFLGDGNVARCIIESRGAPKRRPSAKVPHAPAQPLVTIPATLEPRPMAPSAVTEASVWLVNPGDRTRRVEKIVSTCGCVETVTFEPTDLAPGAAFEVRLSVRAPKTAGEVKTKELSIALDGDELVTLPVRVEAVDPRVSAVLDYLEANERRDADRIHGLLADDFEMNAEGGSARLDAWNAFDWELRTAAHVEELSVDDGGVTLVLAESSDFLRLLDHPYKLVQLAFGFDDENRISSLAVSPLEDDALRKRFETFLTWARASSPAQLQELYGAGTIVPGLEQAQAWRILLTKWRKSRVRR